MIFIISITGSCDVKEVQKPSPFINNIKTGEAFCIKLPENHSLGEMWGMSEEYNTHVVEKVNAVWHGDDKGIYFHLKGKNKGQTELKFIKRKYADTVETKSFTVKVSQH